ncbi:MAG: hypothetical protein ACYT04_69330, partial [Nostoc sp.]
NCYEVAHISLNQPENKVTSKNVQDTSSQQVTKIKQWIVDCFEQNSEYPSHLEICEAWSLLTGQALTDNALKLLIAKLGI